MLQVNANLRKLADDKEGDSCPRANSLSTEIKATSHSLHYYYLLLAVILL
jgi:hypothetical protein